MSALSLFNKIDSSPIGALKAIPAAASLNDTINNTSPLSSTLSTGYIRVNQVYSKTDYPELANILGSINGGVFTKRTGTPYTYITHTGSKFWAVNPTQFITSTDGITWSAPTTWASVGVTLPSIGTIEYGSAGYFVSTGASDSSTYYKSTDLVTWTSGSTGALRPMCSTYGSGKYVVGHWSGAMRVSTDLVTWTNTTSPLTTYIVTMNYVNNRFFATTGSSRYLYHSTNLTTWTSTAVGTNDYFLYGLDYDGARYIIGGIGYRHYTTDLVTWTGISSGGGGSGYTYMVHAFPGGFYSVDSGGVAARKYIWDSSSSKYIETILPPGPDFAKGGVGGVKAYAKDPTTSRLVVLASGIYSTESPWNKVEYSPYYNINTEFFVPSASFTNAVVYTSPSGRDTTNYSGINAAGIYYYIKAR